jgi:hypothetical protein
MAQPFLARSGSLYGGFLLSLLAAVPLVAQKPAAPAPKASAATAQWKAPRTPWGDPDISGVFTNRDVNGVPFERAAEFAGRQYLTEEEYNKRLGQSQANDEEEGPLPALAAGNPGGGPPHWVDRGRGKATRLTSLVIEPADGRLPPLTDEAKKRPQEAFKRSTTPGPWDGPEDLGLYDRCISRGLPGSMMPTIYGNSYQIVQGQGYVGILYEMIHEARIIPIDGAAPALAPRITEYMGDGHGRWDGNSLVVETRNFRIAYRGSNPEKTRLIERFTPVDANTVEWRVTVDDPSTWVRQWTFAVPLTRDSSQPPYEYACHEGNYAMFNILRGSREIDKERAQASIPR